METLQLRVFGLHLRRTVAVVSQNFHEMLMSTPGGIVSRRSRIVVCRGIAPANGATIVSCRARDTLPTPRDGVAVHRKPAILLLPLLLATLLLRGLMPAGRMPVIGADGIVMTVCGGDCAVRVDTDHAPGQPPVHEAPCAFTAMAPLLPDVPLVAVVLLVAIAGKARVLRLALRPLPRRQYRPPGAGPPVLQHA